MFFFRFFFRKTSSFRFFSKAHQSSLNLKVFRKPTSPHLTLMRDFFRKPTSPPLPLREGPPLISIFSPQGRRGNRSFSSLVTISFYGWRTIRGLRQQRSCILRYATAGTRIAYGLQKGHEAHNNRRTSCLD